MNIKTLVNYNLQYYVAEPSPSATYQSIIICVS